MQTYVISGQTGRVYFNFRKRRSSDFFLGTLTHEKSFFCVGNTLYKKELPIHIIHPIIIGR